MQQRSGKVLLHVIAIYFRMYAQLHCMIIGICVYICSHYVESIMWVCRCGWVGFRSEHFALALLCVSRIQDWSVVYSRGVLYHIPTTSTYAACSPKAHLILLNWCLYNRKARRIGGCNTHRVKSVLVFVLEAYIYIQNVRLFVELKMLFQFVVVVRRNIVQLYAFKWL